jgi:hypothetical protein
VLGLGVPDELEDEPLDPEEPLSLELPSFFDPVSFEAASLDDDFDSSLVDFFGLLP